MMDADKGGTPSKKMIMRYRTATLIAVAVLALGGTASCATSADQAEPTPALTGREGAATPLTTSRPQTTAQTDDPVELKTGQKITVRTEDGPAEITLLAVHRTTAVSSESGTQTPDAGTQWVIYSMQVKNLGSTGEWNTSWLESPRWAGSNGEADSPVFVVGPSDPKLIPYDAFSSTPEPRPGEHIKATEVLQVPKVSGTLQFESDNGTTNFSITIK
ncbi:hypothetical protein ACN2WE_00050 [Streptomyces sp. cg28]|uniref:hypothetical protein n=1 Tax=Streptomyces sp. cg28 TaxID=3403457 RepID=UPI003B215B35